MSAIARPRFRRPWLVFLALAALTLALGLTSCQNAPATAPPEATAWWNDAVFYEVFVRSFSDSDGDGNGDLQGLIDKLDYLNDGDDSAELTPHNLAERPAPPTIWASPASG